MKRRCRHPLSQRVALGNDVVCLGCSEWRLEHATPQEESAARKKLRRVGQLVHLARLDMTPKCGSRGSRVVTVDQSDTTAVTCPKCRATLVAGAVARRRSGGL